MVNRLREVVNGKGVGTRAREMQRAKAWRRAYRELVIVVSTLLAAVGCQSPGSGPKGTALPAGATISLLVPVLVPAGHAHVGLPVKAGGAPSGYETRCLLEVENVGESPQEVPPGEYRVEKTTTEQTYFVDGRREPLLMASNRLLLAGEGASPRYRVTNLFFEPNQAADIYRLGCSRLGGRNTAYVTIADMKLLLSGVVEFHDPGIAP